MVPVMVGANDYDLAVSAAQTKDALFAMFGALASEARHLYDPKGEATLKDLLQAVMADFRMIEPSRHLAGLTAKAGQPSYFYRFAYVPAALREKVPGATHGSEILFVFDAVAASLKEKASGADVAMGKTMSGYWVDFVKTGNPNGGGRPAWPRYDPAMGDVLSATNSAVAFGPDPLKERLDRWRAVWEQGR
jgi:para-nitrobenzyl esterase